MTDLNEKIDAYYRKDRWKQIRATAYLLPAIVIFLWFMAPNGGSTFEVEGLVEQMAGLASDEGDQLYLRVRLDDDSVVRVRIKSSLQYRPGSRVRLVAQEPLTFGRTIYRFYGYVPDEP